MDPIAYKRELMPGTGHGRTGTRHIHNLLHGVRQNNTRYTEKCNLWKDPLQLSPKKIGTASDETNSGGGLIDNPSKVTTQTADITTTQLLFNRVVSTKGAKFMCCNIKILPRYPYGTV